MNKPPKWVRPALAATLLGLAGTFTAAIFSYRQPEAANASISDDEVENLLELNKPPILSKDAEKSKRDLEKYIKSLSPVDEKTLPEDKLHKRNHAVSDIADRSYASFLSALDEGKDLKTACRSAAKTAVIGYLEDHRGPHNICPHNHAANGKNSGWGR